MVDYWELPLFQGLIAFHRDTSRTAQSALESNYAAGANKAHDRYIIFQECKRELYGSTLWHFGVSDQQNPDLADILSRALDLTLPIFPQL